MTPIPLPIPLPFPLLISLTALTFLGTLVFSRLAIQLRLPAVLGVLALGLLLHHNQRLLSLEQVENLHVVSLAMLLFCSGLNAELDHLRGFLRYGVLLALGGVLLTTLVFGGLLWGLYASLAAFWPGLGIGALPIPVALMAAACLSCTDAMASLEVLGRAGLRLPQRLRALVEMEASLNAPLAILVVLLVMALASAGWLQPQAGGDPFALLFAVQSFLKSIGSGVMVGLILSFVAQFILRRFLSSSSQILLLGIAVALSSYGLAQLLHGSGFIAAYVTGLFLANDIYANRWITPERLEHSLEPFNTLTEFVVFLLFGTLISPASIVDALLPGLLSALALILIARPLSVLALQPLSPFGRREGLLLAWCGLRGAVPLALAYTAVHALPSLPGLDEARAAVLEHQLEGLIFLVVVGNLVLQGLSLPPLSRRLGLAVPS
jgi:cell volume regulation protein A